MSTRKSAVKTIQLARDETIIAVVPERCAGPGWANATTWVYILGKDKSVRCECIQPEERSDRLHALFDVGESVVRALKDAVPRRIRRKP